MMKQLQQEMGRSEHYVPPSLPSIVENITLTGQESEKILNKCASSVDDFIAFAFEMEANEEQKESAMQWAQSAMTALAGAEETTVDIRGLALLVRTLHGFAIHAMKDDLHEMLHPDFVHSNV